MAKFNSACFLLIAELLFILDQANAKGRGGGRGRGGGFSGYSDGEPGFSGFEIFLIVVAALAFLISIVYCCLQIANICDDDDEEKQEDPTQLESVHSVQHGQDKSSNDQPLHHLPILHNLLRVRIVGRYLPMRNRLLHLVPAGNTYTSYQIRHLRNPVSFHCHTITF